MPLDFQRLLTSLIAHLRERVRSGETTERRLARLTGVSQPHIHHVLSGKRLLSVQMADQILHRLQVDLRDLIEPPDAAR